MAYFNRDNRSGGGRSFGPRRDFGGRGGGDREMHRAICSNCGKECEVPFKPTGSKPVYCSDCFEKQGRDSGPRRFDDRGPRRPNFEFRNNEQPQNKEQFNALNAKLDKILAILQPNTQVKPSVTAPIIEVEEIIKLPDPPAGGLASKKKTKKPKKSVSPSPEVN